jgi:5'-nucleotidase
MVKNSAGKEVLVTQAWSYSAAYADINLEIDQNTKEIKAKWANIATVNSGIAPDPAVQGIVERADKMVAPVVNEVEGEAGTNIIAKQNNAGESALGDLIADAQRIQEDTLFAFVNPGGIRNDLKAGPVTWGRLFDTQPFGNEMVTMLMTGQQIYDVLAEQWSDAAHPKMLQVSGLTYQWRSNGAGRPGSIIDGSVKTADGQVIDRAASYKVATNDFLAEGGDRFSTFKAGKNQVVGKQAVDDLAAYVKTLPNPFRAPADTGKRVTLAQ